MKTGIVYHMNRIEEEVNLSFAKHPDEEGGYAGRSIFCKRRHSIIEPAEDDCTDCQYYAGLMMGHGHECAWEDVVDDMVGGDTRMIAWEDR